MNGGGLDGVPAKFWLGDCEAIVVTDEFMKVMHAGARALMGEFCKHLYSFWVTTDSLRFGGEFSKGLHHWVKILSKPLERYAPLSKVPKQETGLDIMAVRPSTPVNTQRAI